MSPTTSLAFFALTPVFVLDVRKVVDAWFWWVNLKGLLTPGGALG